MKKPTKTAKSPRASRPEFPPGWDEERVRRVLAHYENQTEDEAVAEDEAAYEAEGQTVMIVPSDLVPAIRQLLGRRQGRYSQRADHAQQRQEPHVMSSHYLDLFRTNK